VADYDRDGRVDLVVTQNGAQTRLYHNTSGQRGIRMELIGPAGNPNALGAVVRLEFPGRSGPAREMHSGSGYWSQDGANMVLATPEIPARAIVQWPGGKRTTTPLPSSAREATIDAEGRLLRSR
jgi:hypothetical protein